MDKEPQTLLDFPIEKQKEFAARRNMSLEEWQAHERAVLAQLDNHQITGYMGEETSKRFLKKMMSATQDVD